MYYMQIQEKKEEVNNNNNLYIGIKYNIIDMYTLLYENKYNIILFHVKYIFCTNDVS